MLRIDETSHTLVAPEATGFVAEAPPARDDLLTLLASGWQAFAEEIGQKHVHYLTHTIEPGVDMLAFDQSSGRITVVLVGDSGRELLGRAMLAGGLVAGWSADELESAHEALKAAVPGDSPRLILVATAWDELAVAAVDWLDRRHGLELQAFKVGTMRFGSERMMTIDDPAVVGPTGAPESVLAADASAGFIANFDQQAPPAPEAAAEPTSSPPPLPAA